MFLLLTSLAALRLHAFPLVKTLTGSLWQQNQIYYGFTDGDTADQAQFYTPYGMALDGSTTNLFLADRDNNAVRRLDINANLTYTFVPNPFVSTNLIRKPVGVAVKNGYVYVLNRGNGTNGSLLQFNQDSELSATIATSLTNAAAMTMDLAGNIYLTVQSNKVLRVAPPYTNLTTIATVTEPGASLQGIAYKYASGQLAVCDSARHGIYSINPGSGVVTTNAGFHGAGDFIITNRNYDTAVNAKFNQPYGVAAAGDDTLIVSDTGNHRVKLVLPGSGIVTNLYAVRSNLWVGPLNAAAGIYPGWWDGTVATPDASGGVEARQPVGLAFGADGVVYVTEQYYHLIRKVTLTGLALPPPPPPAAPVINVPVYTNYGVIILTWNSVSGATNYAVKRALSSGGPYNTLTNTTATSYTDTNVINGTTYYYVVSASNSGGESPNSTEVSATPPIPPPNPPRIGWFEYTGSPAVSLLHQVSGPAFSSYNDLKIAIDPTTTGINTYYTTDGSSPTNTAGSRSTPPPYQDGSPLDSVTPLAGVIGPILTIKALNVGPGGNSSVATASFQFIVGNPIVSGNNAAQFAISDITSGATLWYTTDGSDPTNTAPSINAGTVIGTNALTLALVFPPGNSNLVFKVRGFKNYYFPSGIATVVFSPTNFTANKITFGFEGGEASSDFVASPGQSFFAPVTLSLLPNTKMNSLQFNLTATNLTGPAISPGSLSFRSMLEKPVPNITPVVYEKIPPAMFTASPPPANGFVYDGNPNFMSLLVTNYALNLLGVGWIERADKTNLFDTTKQDLISFSQAHDTLFQSSGGKVIAGGFAFAIPPGATAGQTYQILIGRPSATTDGYGAPGSDVYIATPTNGALGAGAINALKTVTVGQRRYTVGDVYPFRWFNAGDYGDSYLKSADVAQVFQAAIYDLNRPPAGSDFFDGMDSCCGTVNTSTNGMYLYPTSLTNTLVKAITNVVNNTVISSSVTFTNIASGINTVLNLTNIVVSTNIISDSFSTYLFVTTNVFISSTNVFSGYITNVSVVTYTTNSTSFTNISYDISAQLPLYDGNDPLINAVAFGDGVLDVADVYVTYRRSLDPSLTWYQRFWTNGLRGAVTTPNIFSTLAASPAPAKSPGKSGGSIASVTPRVIFTAGDALTGPGQTIAVPITASILGSYPLRVLMLGLTVEPLDGSPAITANVQFTPNPALGTPYSTSQQGANNYGAVWLNSGIAGLTGSASIGTLQITLPAGAPTNAAYAVSFDHVSASPNGTGVFPKTTYDGLVTLADRSGSSWNDGISDTWRLRNFGTIYNQLSAAHADADGDGDDNLKEYRTGTNPNDSKSVLRMLPQNAPFNVRWPSILGKTYIIERSTTLYGAGWTAIATNSGTGGDLQVQDTGNVGNVRFYRVRVP